MYYMTIKNTASVSMWVRCKSDKLLGAKQEARKNFRDEVKEGIICLAEGRGTNANTILESKVGDNKWHKRFDS